MTPEELYTRLRGHLEARARACGLADDRILVRAHALSPEEAIGSPEHDDYSLVVGRERLMEAELRGALGHAFTDMYGQWSGPLRDVWAMAPTNNFRRAILVSALNAITRLTGEGARTLHCKNTGPVDCAGRLGPYLAREGLRPPFALIGYQPRLAEALAELGELRIVDGDARNIGEWRAGVRVGGPAETDAALRGAGGALVTGSTIVNATLVRFLGLGVPTVFYGVTVAGAASILGLTRYCPLAV
jgi:hypothetical protein